MHWNHWRREICADPAARAYGASSDFLVGSFVLPNAGADWRHCGSSRIRVLSLRMVSTLPSIGRIECIAFARCSLLRHMSHVAWSVRLSVSVCVCFGHVHGYTVQNGCTARDAVGRTDSCGFKMGSRLDESIRSREEWQVDDAAVC